MLSRSFWFCLVVSFVIFDQSDGWRRRRRRRCPFANCAVSGWSHGPCPVACGKGTQLLTRYVTRGAQCGGSCPYSLRHTQPCNKGCPNGGTPQTGRCLCQTGYSGQCCTGVDGGWSSWNSWSTCSKACGTGQQVHRRSCTSPPPSNGGRPCAGAIQQSQACNIHSCPVNGGWSNWSRWRPCSRSCGIGSQERFRSCTQPPPSHGGTPCQGATHDKQICNKQPCPIDGSWSSWNEESTCSQSCGTGFLRRYRTCNQPPPNYGGKHCDGASWDTQQCNRGPCPVHGAWSDWSEWTSCSESCGSGSQERSRSCTRPPPSYDGKFCEGSSRETQQCNRQPCPVDGGWSDWRVWTPCSKSCETGTQNRSRTCTQPSPQHGGKTCAGVATEDRPCNTQQCPDLEPPKIDPCPKDIKIISLVRWHKLILPPASVTDNKGVELFTTNIQNGSEVSWGKYDIIYAASDKAGNTVECRFLITISAIQCPSLPIPSNGVKAGCSDPLWERYGTICRFSCNAGYSLTGSYKRQCQENETWSGLTTSCLVITCKALVLPVNVAISPPSCLSTSPAYGQTCKFYCPSAGYALEGTSSRVCGNDGEWTGTDDVVCRDNTPPSFNDTCPRNMLFYVPKCSSATIVSWNEPVANDNSGHVIISYPALRPPANLSIGLYNIRYSATDDEENRKNCSFIVEVTRKSCPFLHPPVHGSIASLSCGLSFGSEATISCNRGYRLVGSHKRSCEESGKWSGSNTTCHFLKCPGIKVPSHGMVIPVQCKIPLGVNYGTNCFLTCNITQGYRLEGPHHVSCLENASWSEDVGKVICKDIEPPNIQCPPDMEFPTDAGQSYATVMWEVPVPTDNSNEPMNLSGLLPPQKLNVGQTHIRYDITDSAGHNESCVFSIDVKDVESPKIDSCPSDIKIISPVQWHKLILPAVTVTDNVGVDIFTTNIQNGSDITWGKHNITYEASDKAGNTAYCKFLITVTDSPCTDLPSPLNGAKACETWLAGMMCTVHCNKGYGFSNNPDTLYYCKPNGKWWNANAGKGEATPALPDCSKTHKPMGALLNGRYHYLTDNCGGKEINKQIASNFIGLIMRTSFGWAGGCYGNPYCKVENVRVDCGQQTRLKRETNDGKEPKRVPLTISFVLQVPMPTYSNTSLDLNETSLQISKDILEALGKAITGLNVSGVVISMDISRPPEIVFTRLICGRGQVQSGASCVNCPLGHFLNSTNGTICQACAVDHYQDQEAQTSCVQCPSGTSTSGQEASRGLHDCKECIDHPEYAQECINMAQIESWCQEHELVTKEKCAKSCRWC